MKNLIRKILKEETPNFNKFERGAFKMIDRIGIEKFIDESLRHMGLDVEEEINIVWKYLKDYGGGCDEYVNFILEANEDTEAFWVPRVNTVAGITDAHIAKWGWRVDDQGWVNFPDWQMRIYRNKEEIYWIKPVHEQLKGYTKFANLPPEEKFALYHPKNIGRQEKQNKFYETI